MIRCTALWKHFCPLYSASSGHECSRGRPWPWRTLRCVSNSPSINALRSVSGSVRATAPSGSFSGGSADKHHGGWRPQNRARAPSPAVPPWGGPRTSGSNAPGAPFARLRAAEEDDNRRPGAMTRSFSSFVVRHRCESRARRGKLVALSPESRTFGSNRTDVSSPARSTVRSGGEPRLVVFKRTVCRAP
jgi:hypothetical protein